MVCVVSYQNGLKKECCKNKPAFACAINKVVGRKGWLDMYQSIYVAGAI